MDSPAFLAVGLLMGFLCAIAAMVLILLWHKPGRSPDKPAAAPGLEALTGQLRDMQRDLKRIEDQVWAHGLSKDEEIKYWRSSYQAFAEKTIAVLHSCWLGRDDDATARAVYHELLSGLQAIGIEEITPEPGEAVDSGDGRYSIRESRGEAPFVMARLIYPGYQLHLRQTGATYLLAPAVVEIEGVKSQQNTGEV